MLNSITSLWSIKFHFDDLQNVFMCQKKKVLMTPQLKWSNREAKKKKQSTC